MSAPLFVVMGVTGSGKSLIGAAFAKASGLAFLDGDDFHSPKNIERMSSGVPLTDSDRAEWLQSLAEKIRAAKNSGSGIVVACSALKRSYRDVLRAGAPELRFIFLKGHRALLAERIANRSGHFMPASLLDSQQATLEEPTPDEDAWVCDVSKSPDEIVAQLVSRPSV